MSKEQIEEMANILWHIPHGYSLNSYNDCEIIAECIYNDGGYRKQREGRWGKRVFVIFDSEKVGYRCSECNTTWDTPTHFCPECGAKMFIRMTHTCPHNIPNLIPTIEEMKGGAE